MLFNTGLTAILIALQSMLSIALVIVQIDVPASRLNTEAS